MGRVHTSTHTLKRGVEKRRQQRGRCILIPFTRVEEIKKWGDWKERKPEISYKHDHTHEGSMPPPV